MVKIWEQLPPDEINFATQRKMGQKRFLEEYSVFLEERGYLDDDWKFESPNAVDEFLKEESKGPSTSNSK
ncbi:MAG: hypothetical protein WC269_06475 [Candidatus Gracilibacteria bacterium]